MRDLLGELDRVLSTNQTCVWCSVVETRGSTPQKAGASMLVFADGSQRGTLGGGCVEAEVKQRALGVLTENGEVPRPELLSFTLDDNYGWDDGLICGGRMTILADPLQDSFARGYHRHFRSVVESGKGGIEAIVLASGAEEGGKPGQRFLFDHQGNFLAARYASCDHPPAIILRNLPNLDRRPSAITSQGIAYLPILPRITIFIVGGGHVGQAVAQLATQADFEIEVLDDRAFFVSEERFPLARKRLVGEIGRTLAEIAPTLRPDHYVLIVTRGHHHDEEALYHLAPSRAGYVGMIGSKRKIRMIYEDLIAKGLPPHLFDRVHAPLGFDIGSQTVPEIAISIVAELIAARNLGSTEPRPHVRIQIGSKKENML